MGSIGAIKWFVALCATASIASAIFALWLHPSQEPAFAEPFAPAAPEPVSAIDTPGASQAALEPIVVEATCAEAAAEPETVAADLRSCRVIIVDRGGNPIPEAAVEFWSLDQPGAETTEQPDQVASTDAMGTVVFTQIARDAHCRIKVSATG